MAKSHLVTSQAAPPRSLIAAALGFDPLDPGFDPSESEAPRRAFFFLIEEAVNLYLERSAAYGPEHSPGEGFDEDISELILQASRVLEEESKKITGQEFDPGEEMDDASFKRLLAFYQEREARGELNKEQKSILAELAAIAPIFKEGAVRVSQVFANAFARQSLSNAKMVLDSKGSLLQQYGGSKISQLPSGWLTRAYANLVGIGGASFVADMAKGLGLSTPGQILLASSIDTAIGTGPEVFSLRNSIEKVVKKDISKKAIPIMCAALPLFFARNTASWVAVRYQGSDEDKEAVVSIAQRGAMGFFFGMFAAIPNALANMSMVEVAKMPDGSSSFKMAKDAMKIAMKDFLQKPLATLPGATVRGIGGALSSVLLSKEGREFLTKIMDSFIDFISEALQNKELLDAFYNEISGEVTDLRSTINEDERKFLQKFLEGLGEELSCGTLDKDDVPKSFYKSPSTLDISEFFRDKMTLQTCAYRPAIRPSALSSLSPRIVSPMIDFADKFLRNFADDGDNTDLPSSMTCLKASHAVQTVSNKDFKRQ